MKTKLLLFFLINNLFCSALGMELKTPKHCSIALGSNGQIAILSPYSFQLRNSTGGIILQQGNLTTDATSTKFNHAYHDFQDMAFSANKKTIAVISKTGTENHRETEHTTYGINIYNTETGTLLQQIPVATSSCITFDPTNNDCLLVNHLSDTNNENHTTRSITMHYLTSHKQKTFEYQTKTTDSIWNWEQRTMTPYVTKPIIAMHPAGYEMTFQSYGAEVLIDGMTFQSGDNKTITVDEHKKSNLIAYLLLQTNESKSFSSLPKELKEVIGNYYKTACNTYTTHQYPSFIEYSPNGQYIAMIAEDQITIYDTKTHKSKQLMDKHKSDNKYTQIASAIFHPNGSAIITLNNIGNIIYYNVRTGQTIPLQSQRLPVIKYKSDDNDSEMTRRLACSPDGKQLFIATRTCVIWIPIPLGILDNLPLKDFKLEHGPHGQYIAMITENQVTIYDIKTDTLKEMCCDNNDSNATITSATFHPNNNIMATLNSLGYVSYYCIHTGEKIASHTPDIKTIFDDNDDDEENTILKSLEFYSDQDEIKLRALSRLSYHTASIDIDIPEAVLNYQPKSFLIFLRNNKLFSIATVSVGCFLAYYLHDYFFNKK